MTSTERCALHNAARAASAFQNAALALLDGGSAALLETRRRELVDALGRVSP